MSATEKLPQNKDLSAYVEKLPKTKVQAVASTLGLFSRLPLAWQLAFAAIGLAAAGFCGYQLQKILFNNQNNLARTLAATMVSTAYPHRGVTAFLIAELDKNIPVESNNQPLKEAVKGIKTNIESLRGSDKGFDENKALGNLRLSVRDKSNLDHSDVDHTWTKIVVSKEMEDRQAFLMVPAISLRQPQVGENTLKNDNDIKKVLHNNPEILFDFYVALQIDEKLKDLRSLPDKPFKPVQAYFISESGVILLRQLPYGKSYKDNFPNNTLFMDRLYFWGAIDPAEFKQEKNSQGPLDYETDPYIDLGGNGVVKTYSERVELPNKRTGVICVDVVLPDTQVQIEERLKALGAKVEKASYIGGQEKIEGPPGQTDFNWVNTQLNGPAKSRITGAIAFESDTSITPPPASAPEVVRFTVPIGSAVNNNGTSETSLLLVTFDFRSSRNWIIGNSAGFALGIGLFVVVMGNLLLQYTSLRREMNRVLENMSTVMYEATTPFAWLNENNEFVKVNVSFLHTLGCETPHELRDYAPTFRDLVTADTLPIYETILQQSGRGEPTPPYQIKIMKRDREIISVRVHGERVPYPTLGRKRSPHRFGVFLPPNVATEEHDTVIDSERGKPKHLQPAETYLPTTE